jgi:hypothetical protein
MSNEERFALAKDMAAETALERLQQRQMAESELLMRIASMSAVEANSIANKLRANDTIPWMKPKSNRYEWTEAVSVARSVTIQAARLGQTITYGALQIVVVDTTRMKVGSMQYGDLAEGINDEIDGCLLSAIVVNFDTGEPGDGFLSFARERGFDTSVGSMQRQVFEHFVEPSDG